MSRPRKTPNTAFGAWLDHWFDEHPEWTVKAFGVAVAEAMGRERPITDGAISQWMSGETKRIGVDVLAGVSVVTGEPLPNLQQLVYGRALAAEPAPQWAAELLAEVRTIRQLLQATPPGGAGTVADGLARRARRAVEGGLEEDAREAAEGGNA